MLSHTLCVLDQMSAKYTRHRIKKLQGKIIIMDNYNNIVKKIAENVTLRL